VSGVLDSVGINRHGACRHRIKISKKPGIQADFVIRHRQPGAVRGYRGKAKANPPDAIGPARFPGARLIEANRHHSRGILSGAALFVVPTECISNHQAVGFNQLHLCDHSRVKQVLYCHAEDKLVSRPACAAKARGKEHFRLAPAHAKHRTLGPSEVVDRTGPQTERRGRRSRGFP
jgi:hypothetical protein